MSLIAECAAARFVASGAIRNSQEVGMAGVEALDFDSPDETRAPEHVNAFENPQQYVEVVKRAYRRDRWTDQPYRVEVWSEKGTVRGTRTKGQL